MTQDNVTQDNRKKSLKDSFNKIASHPKKLIVSVIAAVALAVGGGAALNQEVENASSMPVASAPAQIQTTAATVQATPATVQATPAQAAPVVASIVLSPTALPAPIAERPPQTVEVALETIELQGKLADGTTFNYWTFNGKVPGPFVRVREGDTVHVMMKNAEGSMVMHNVDFHAVTGPGGGAAATVAMPGETGEFTFKAMNPGIYVYHCATAPVAWHIAKGMYGMILVEPKVPLEPVDHEFYVMQGEIYTRQAHGTAGALDDDYQKLIDEAPEYYVFNGASGALVTDAPLKAKVGETIRIYFGVGGPNKTSSFHVIGEIFDKAYQLGALTSEPLTNVQTITVPPGGATVVEMKLEVPGKYMLVDHALSRATRGLLGILEVEGAENPEVFKPAKPAQKPPSMQH